MVGTLFSKYIANNDSDEWDFDRIRDLFLELILHTSGDIEESFDWLNEIGQNNKIFDEDYSFEDFKNDLITSGFFQPEGKGSPGMKLSAGTEKLFRQKAFEQIFGKVKRSSIGNHNSNKLGTGSDQGDGLRPFAFGDNPAHIDFSTSLQQGEMLRNIANDDFGKSSWLVKENFEANNFSTVVMIDISHSMILYGEDRITPAKKVALALAQYIGTKYPKDSIDFVVFGNDAWEVNLKDLPYLTVGPYHTNTVAGLELSMNVLRRRKNINRQIFMITDGKPTCLKEGKGYYKNSNYGHDPKIIRRCLNLAKQCRKLKIPVTTFMIATDPYLQSFVEQFTEANDGKAFYSGLNGLGELIFEDYERNKKKNF
jgi:uncharacterized protein with von Willebrand factor type A (vWA) domain